MMITLPDRVEVVIRHRVEQTLERVEAACRRAGRSPETVTLIAVTKTFPLEVVEASYEAGLRHFGENRVQELIAKSGALPGFYQGGDVHWHMIGHVQRNKAKEVVACADFVHAVDSLRLAAEFEKRAAAEGRKIPCMIQVNVSGEQSKFGLQPANVPAFLDEVCQYEHIQFSGFMTLASPAADPESIRPQFRLLKRISDQAAISHASCMRLHYLSMGMSGDFEVAIEEGATHVRVGSALFGART